MRTYTVIGYLLACVGMVFAYQNCSGVHESNASLSSFEACNLVLKDQFSNGYHQFLTQNCNGCHVSNGTGNGAFGDNDLDIAFDAFNVRGNILVENRALDPNHQPPFTGPQHQGDIIDLDEGWYAAKAQADLCIANAGVTIENEIEGGVITNDPQPTTHAFETFIKLIDADKDGTTIQWDLSDEILLPNGTSFPGARLEIEVTALSTVTGEKSYIISNPKLRAGDQALHFQYFGVKINNQVVQEANSFHQINRKIPPNTERDLATSSLVFRYDIRATDTISVLIGNIQTTTFNPPTFDELIAPTGVFGANCMSCHDGGTGNPQAGFDISNRNAVLTQLMVAPYSPNNSEIFKRMNDTQRPMPQSGILSDPALEQVLWWIQDGAR